jgi:PKD repeat protein
VLSGDAWFEYTIAESSSVVQAGFTAGQVSDPVPTYLDFGVYPSQGALYVQEGQQWRGPFGSYAVGDRVRVEVRSSPASVKYYRNGIVFYTSTLTPTWPMIVFAKISTLNATVSNAVVAANFPANQAPTANPGGPYSGRAGEPVVLSGSGSSDPDGSVSSYAWNFGDSGSGAGVSPVHVYASPGTYTAQLTVTDDEGLSSAAVTTTVTVLTPLQQLGVAWKNFVNTQATGSTLTKVSGAADFWDAKAMGAKGVVSGDAWFEYTIAESSSVVQAGFTAGQVSDPVPTYLDFGVFPSQGTLYVQEGQQWRGPFGSYAVGDRVRVEVRSSPASVKYYRNGILFYTSALTPTWPLIVFAKISTLNATVSNAVVAADFPPNEPPTANPGGPYNRHAGGLVTFNGAASNDPDGAVSTYLWDFGDGSTGAGAAPTHAYAAAGSYAVRLTVVDNEGASAPEVATVAVIGPPLEQRNVRWKNFVNTQASGGSLTKVSGAAEFWDGKAMGTKGVLSGDAWFEYTVAEPSSIVQAGFTVGSVTSSIPIYLDFGVYTSQGALYVQEGQQWHGSFGPCAVGDRLRVEVGSAPPSVKYYRNGALYYTSALAPTWPLMVFARISTLNATVSNAVVAANFPANLPPRADAGLAYEGNVGDAIKLDGRASSDNDGGLVVDYQWDFGDGSSASGATATHTYSAAGTYTVRLTVTDDEEASHFVDVPVTIGPAFPRTPVKWVQPVGVALFGDEIRKISGAEAWDSGAVSKRLIASGDGYAEMVVQETTLRRMFGLANGNSDAGYEDIEYGLYLGADTVHIYEAGIGRGAFGTYEAGDVFRVALRAGVVRYLRNGRVFYQSTVTPSYPLLVDTTFLDIGATVKTAMMGRQFNAPPVANPGGPYTVPVGNPLTLNGTGSNDPDGELAVFDWGFSDLVPATGPTPIRTFTTEGSFSVTLTVTDDEGAESGPASTTIQVVPNQPPTLSLSTSGPCHASCTASITATVSDPEGRPVSLVWSGCAEGQTGTVVTCSMSTATTRTVTATASDGWNPAVVRNVQVQSTNAAPSVPTITVSNSGCTVPCDIQLTAAATDPDGDPLAFEWGGCALGKIGATAVCRAEAAGTFPVSVSATDGRGGKTSATSSATAVASSSNIAPESNTGGPYRGVVGRSITLDGRLSRDIDGQVVTYAWTFGDGQGASGAVVQHTYAGATTWSAVLTVTDDDDATHAKTVSVIIEANIDPDNDGLTNTEEQALGSNPNDDDSNDDGIKDGAAMALGLSLTSPDTDTDGLSNTVEISGGTDPIRGDTDGDGVADGVDAFPLDPSRSAMPAPDPGDTTPPTITIERPTGAVVVP